MRSGTDKIKTKKKSLSLVISCIDYRFWPHTLPLLKKKYGSFDLIDMAGSTKNLTSPVKEADRKALTENIQTSIKLHNPKKIILTNHLDCGAYGGSQCFKNQKSEIEFHRKELRKAKKIVIKEFPKMKVETVIVKKTKSGKISIIRAGE